MPDVGTKKTARPVSRPDGSFTKMVTSRGLLHSRDVNRLLRSGRLWIRIRATAGESEEGRCESEGFYQCFHKRILIAGANQGSFGKGPGGPAPNRFRSGSRAFFVKHSHSHDPDVAGLAVA